MPQHNIDVTWSRGANSADPVAQRVTKSAQAELILGDDASPLQIADSTTDGEVVAALDVSALKSLMILSDQNVTIETNDGSSADDTLTLVGGEPLVWWDGCGYSCPLTADVTAFYITNASGATANVQMRFLSDPTP